MYLAASDVGGAILGLLLWVGAFVLYFFPSIVAFNRHHQAGMVLVLNFFLGWTLIGWVVALAIAFGSETQPAQAQAPVMSPDGKSWWDGAAWRPMNTQNRELPRARLYKPPQD